MGIGWKHTMYEFPEILFYISNDTPHIWESGERPL